MAIWEYSVPEVMAPRIRWFLKLVRNEETCPFCEGIELVRWVDNRHELDMSRKELGGGLDSVLSALADDEQFFRKDVNDYVFACGNCGWWCAVQVVDTLLCDNLDEVPAPVRTVAGAIGNLVNFSNVDLAAPLAEAKRYLETRFAQARSDVDPDRFADVVVSILRDMGFRSRATGRMNDKGIDIVLDGPGDVLVGVQVKRTKNSIEIDQLNSLVGALVRRRFTTGIFVTSSRFQSGAAHLVDDVAISGYAVELVDGQRFLEALRINTRRMYESPHELLDRYQKSLITLGEWDLENPGPDDDIW